jgi:hypothetical protein
MAAIALVAAVQTSSADAQTPPATFYGVAGSGDAVAAVIDGAVCASVTAGPDGFWLLTVPQGGACGAADQKDIHFTLNGASTSAVEQWRSGGAPQDAAAGVALVAADPKPAPAPQPPPAVDAFVGTRPADGRLGLLVTGTATRATDLLGALEGHGCSVRSLAVLTGGRWKVFIPGAPDAINAAFPSDLGLSTAFAVRC